MSPLRHRPLLVPATCLIVAALSLAACGDDDEGSASQTASTPTLTSAPPDTRFDGALWPDPADATEAATPVDVARSFVEDFIGMENPALGEFQQGDSRSGEVGLLQRGEDGTVRKDRVLSSIAVRQLDGTRWFVIAAIADDVEIDEPELSAVIASPVRVAGKGVGFEGNVVLRVHAAFDPKPLAEKPVIAGSTKLEPFSADLEFERPAASTGAIVARTGGGLAGTDPFSAFPVRFATAP